MLMGPVHSSSAGKPLHPPLPDRAQDNGLPADVVQLQEVARRSQDPRARSIAHLALRLPNPGQIARDTLRLLGQGIPGPLSVALAHLGLKAMHGADRKTRGEVGHMVLSTIETLGESESSSAGRVLRLAQLEDPHAAQTYETALLQMTPPPPIPGDVALRHPTSRVSPGENFFEFANKKVNPNWMESLLGKSGDHRLQQAQRESVRLSQQIWDELTAVPNPPRGSAAQKVQDFKQASGDMAARDRAGLQAAGHLLQAVENIQCHGHLGLALHYLHRQGMQVLLTPGQATTEYGTARVSLTPNATLPGSDLHRAVHDPGFSVYAGTLFQAAGDSPEQAEHNARVAHQVALYLSGADSEKSELIHFQSPDSLPPGLGWKDYHVIDALGTSHPAHLASLSAHLSQVPLADLKTFLRYAVLSDLARDLGSTVVAARQKSDRRLGFDVIVSPTIQTQGYLSDVFQQEFCDRAVTPEKKALVEQIFEDVKNVFSEQLDSAPGYSDGARLRAQGKLRTMKLEVGQPSEGFPKIEADIRADSHLANVLQIKAQRAASLMDCESTNEWGGTDQVNAYNLPWRNSVVLTAAFLLDPRLSGRRDNAELYGTLGFVLAHELGHSFDPTGTWHDCWGHQTDWLGPEDRKTFEASMAVVDEQLKHGEKSLDKKNASPYRNETAADLIGLPVAYEAFLRRNTDRGLRDGYNPEQRFFLNFASVLSQRQAGSARPGDAHPTNEFRINNSLRNSPAFAAAFGLGPTAPMVFAAGQRVKLW